MFSSNNTPAYEFQKVRELGSIINLDDISYISFLEKTCGIPEIISVRYNPIKFREGSLIMGDPENAKYGSVFHINLMKKRLAWCMLVIRYIKDMMKRYKALLFTRFRSKWNADVL
jgi:hypothetical protein